MTNSKYWEDLILWYLRVSLLLLLLLLIGVLLVIFKNALAAFSVKDLYLLETKSGKKFLGEIWLNSRVAEDNLRLRVGNRDIYGKEFIVVKKDEIESIRVDKDAVLVERVKWGVFIGYLKELIIGNRRVDPEISIVEKTIKKVEKLREKEHELSRNIARLSNELRVVQEKSSPSPYVLEELKKRIETLFKELDNVRAEISQYKLVASTVEGDISTLDMGNVVRVVASGKISYFKKSKIYLSRIWDFLSEYPAESNTAGGIMPAIFGTAVLVFVMTIMVLPFGVIAAVYMHEYAQEGWLINLVRVAVSNLAAVPSIVFGMFGLGFFIYRIGGTIDSVFFPYKLPHPTFGTGGLLWASATLAILTLPVVIVATEEGLASVPRVVREGALALGATKWEVIKGVVLPGAIPGILTGAILAISRAAGEVAPLMLVGVVKMAPELPISGEFPFIHLNRKFMHLGFHIYDLAFQSPNVESVEPLIFATSAVLLVIVLLSNAVTISLRNYLRKRYTHGL